MGASAIGNWSCECLSCIGSVKMSVLKDLLSRVGQFGEIKGYLNKMNDSLVLIKRCIVILVFLAGLTVFLTEWL
jgi:hypothetical protein